MRTRESRRASTKAPLPYIRMTGEKGKRRKFLGESRGGLSLPLYIYFFKKRENTPHLITPRVFQTQTNQDGVFDGRIITITECLGIVRMRGEKGKRRKFLGGHPSLYIYIFRKKRKHSSRYHSTGVRDANQPGRGVRATHNTQHEMFITKTARSRSV